MGEVHAHVPLSKPVSISKTNLPSNEPTLLFTLGCWIPSKCSFIKIQRLGKIISSFSYGCLQLIFGLRAWKTIPKDFLLIFQVLRFVDVVVHFGSKRDRLWLIWVLCVFDEVERVVLHTFVRSMSKNLWFDSILSRLFQVCCTEHGLHLRIRTIHNLTVLSFLRLNCWWFYETQFLMV